MERKTKKCIVCLSDDIFCSTGHLREYPKQHIDDTISACFCEKHRDTPCPDIIVLGCYGFYNKNYEVEEDK